VKKNVQKLVYIKYVRIFVRSIRHKQKIKVMNFQELNTLIESLKKDKKANKDLIKFYESKRRTILTEAFNKGFEK
jgi:hypothetical protein